MNLVVDDYRQELVGNAYQFLIGPRRPKPRIEPKETEVEHRMRVTYNVVDLHAMLIYTWFQFYYHN